KENREEENLNVIGLIMKMAPCSALENEKTDDAEYCAERDHDVARKARGHNRLRQPFREGRNPLIEKSRVCSREWCRGSVRVVCSSQLFACEEDDGAQ